MASHTFASRVSRYIRRVLKRRFGKRVKSVRDTSDQEFLRLLQASAADSASTLLQRIGERSDEQWLSIPSALTDLRIDLSRMSDSEIIARANAALDGDLHPSGLRPRMRGECLIDWAFNPAASREWLLMIHRHSWWVLWGSAYKRTGDERYAQAFVLQLVDWIDQNPMPAQKSEHLESWRLMEAGLRMRVSWIPAFACFYGSDAFTDDVKLKALRAIYDHAQFLCRFHTNRNHLVRESNGLIAVGFCFPEFKASEDWITQGLERLDRELQGQVNRDGSHIEMSVGYQWLAIDEFEVTRSLLRQFERKLPNADLEGVLQKMYGFLASVIRPDRSFPQLNDGFILWDARRLEESGNAESVPKPGSISFPNAGLHVMRSDGTPDACYLVADTGPYGGPHGHEDKLSFELFAYGTPFIVDPGSYTYDRHDDYRNYFVGSQGHNTVVVDGKSQIRRWYPQHMTPVVDDVCHGQWRADSDFDFASGVYSEGYASFALVRPDGAAVDRDVVHQRDFVFAKPDYWIVIDYLGGTKVHDYSFMFHLEPGTVIEEHSGSSALIRSARNGARLIMQAMTAKNLTSRVIEGQAAPIQGWYSQDHHKKCPAPALVFETQQSRSAFVVWVLCPLRPGEDAGRFKVKSVAEQTCSHLAFEVHADGKVDSVSVLNNAKSRSNDVPDESSRISIIRDGKGEFRSA